MGSLLVQEFLLSGGSPEQLLASHGVKAKTHNGKVSLVYDQLAARNDDPLACQCRGLILREGTWEVVARPFDRFFNHGQVEAAEIDWGTARFEEKLDGTLLIVYFDSVPGRWLCATRSMCEAHGDINGVGTFADLADRAARNVGVGADSLHALMDGVGADRSLTHLFELTGPYNMIVCQYADLGLTLLGARVTLTGEEICPLAISAQFGFEVAKTWHFDNIDHLVEVIRDWDPTKFEGVVVKDAAFNRIKVKSPKYLAVAHAGESLGSSWKSCCEAVAAGTVDDIMHLLPPLAAERVARVKLALADLEQETEADWDELRGIENMKEFALAAQKKRWSAALFALKRSRVGSIVEFTKQASPEHLLGLCESQLGGAK